MTSGAEAIAQAVHARLSALSTVPAARVYRDLVGALTAGKLPAIVVETGNEEAPEPQAMGAKKMRSVDIRVTVLAAGENAFGAADPVVVESFGALIADPKLGGLAFDLTEGPTVRERETAESNIAGVTKLYRYRYRTAGNSLS